MDHNLLSLVEPFQALIFDTVKLREILRGDNRPHFGPSLQTGANDMTKGRVISRGAPAAGRQRLAEGFK
jgi:hypothetical protein